VSSALNRRLEADPVKLVASNEQKPPTPVAAPNPEKKDDTDSESDDGDETGEAKEKKKEKPKANESLSSYHTNIPEVTNPERNNNGPSKKNKNKKRDRTEDEQEEAPPKRNKPSTGVSSQAIAEFGSIMMNMGALVQSTSEWGDDLSSFFEA